MLNLDVLDWAAVEVGRRHRPGVRGVSASSFRPDPDMQLGAGSRDDLRSSLIDSEVEDVALISPISWRLRREVRFRVSVERILEVRIWLG